MPVLLLHVDIVCLSFVFFKHTPYFTKTSQATMIISRLLIFFHFFKKDRWNSCMDSQTHRKGKIYALGTRLWGLCRDNAGTGTVSI